MLAITFHRVAGASAMDTFFYVLLSTGVISVISKPCSESYYKGCRSQLQRFTDKPSLIFAEHRQELDIKCKKAQDSLNCIEDFPHRCLVPDNWTRFDDISGLRDVMLGMCRQEFDLQNRYLEVLPYLKNLSTDLEFCHVKHERNQKDIEVQEYEDKEHMRCCALYGYRHCLRLASEKTQGEGTEDLAKVLDDIALRKGGYFAKHTCADQFDRCRGSAHRTLGSSFLTLLAALSIVFVSTVRSDY